MWFWDITISKTCMLYGLISRYTVYYTVRFILSSEHHTLIYTRTSNESPSSSESIHFFLHRLYDSLACRIRSPKHFTIPTSSLRSHLFRCRRPAPHWTIFDVTKNHNMATTHWSPWKVPNYDTKRYMLSYADGFGAVSLSPFEVLQVCSRKHA